MSSWVAHPTCLEIDVDVEETFKIPDPLWPGLGFAIALVIGGIIGGILAKFCLRDYLKKRSQDEEEATLIAQGVPLHLRGRDRNNAFPSHIKPLTLQSEKTMIQGDGTFVDTPRAGAVTPSNIMLDGDSKGGLSDALILSTGDSTQAEIAQQDVREFLNLEERLRNERIEALIALLITYLNKLVEGNKISQEESDKVVSDMTKRCEEVVERNKTSEAATIQGLQNDQKLQKNDMAMQTEKDKIHANHVQKINLELSNLESEIPHLLATLGGLTDDDVDAVMAKLKHQLATREKKVGDETRRQIKSLEERLARRRELAEQNRLRKQAAADLINSKVQQHSNSLQLMVNKDSVTEDQKNEIIKNYERELVQIQNTKEEERHDQEMMLNEKLAKKRRVRLKKLTSQQNKSKAELEGKIRTSTNTASIQTYDDLMQNQHKEMEETIAELDDEEARQLNQLAEAAQADFSQQCAEADEKLAEDLSSKTNIDEADVSRIIKLHKAEMKEFERNRVNEQKTQEAKLQEKLALRRQKREETEKEEQRAFQALKVQQEEMVQKVIQTQADLPEDAAAAIMAEHKRNMERVNNQLSVSKLRQQKQLEERLAQRRARLAEKQQASEALSLSTDSKQATKEQKKLEAEVEEEKKKIKQDHEAALIALRERLAEETQQALQAQEQQISQMIGQLEVGQARRRNIIQKQDKLITELENQLSNKVGDNPKGFTTTNELMQKHYGQVEALTNSLANTKERQEQALQERLDQKRLRREAEIKEQMKVDAKNEMEAMRARGAGVASNILLDMMLQQRHEKAMEELEQEMKVELQRARDQMNQELNEQMMAALSDEGKNFMANLAANSELSNEDLTDAMKNAAKSDRHEEKQKALLGEERFNVLEVHRTSRNLLKQLRLQQHALLHDEN